MSWNLIRRNKDHMDGFSQLQRQINTMFDEFDNQSHNLFQHVNFVPAVDVTEEESQIIVKADIPGMEQKDIDVQIKDHILTIKGERKQEKDHKDEHGTIREMSYGSFQRSFSIPEGYMADKANATYKNGVLSIEIPKDPVKAPKQISVKVN